jgi:hypothetical protein
MGSTSKKLGLTLDLTGYFKQPEICLCLVLLSTPIGGSESILIIKTLILVYMIKISLQVILLLSLVFGIPSQVFSQNVVVQTRHVPAENVSDFIHRETTYWSKIAQKAIDDGKLSGWSLWQRVDGFDIDKDPNFFFMNTFTDEQFDNNDGSIWNVKKVFPDAKKSDIDTFSLGTVQDQLFYRNLVFIEKSPPQFLRVNYAKASNLNRYLELEKTVWQPFVKKQMDAGKTEVVSWILSVLVMPSGANTQHNAVTVDGFDTLSDALNNSFDFPDLSEFAEVHQKAEIHVYHRVASATAKE